MAPAPSFNVFDGCADAGALVAAALAGLLPQDVLAVDAYVTLHRRMADVAGRYVDHCDLARTPYLVEPMRALTDPAYHTVAVAGPGQSGKTLIAEGWLQQTVGCDPGPLLWYLPTDPVRDAYVKERINPLIRGHEHDLLAKLGTGPTDNSLRYKRFGSMSAQFLSASTANLINKTARKIVGDEIDAYDESLGDVKVLFDVRRQYYGPDSMALLLSHCDRAKGLNPERDWNAGIMAVYKDSTQGTWWWPCQRCGAFCSPNPGTLRHMPLYYLSGKGVPLDEVQASAALRCPVCLELNEDHERRAMNADGFWAYHGEDVSRDGRVSGARVKRPIAGYWIVGAMSPFLMEGIGGVVRALVKAEREAQETGDTRSVKEVTVKQVGFPYTPPKTRTGSIDANALAERAEDYRLRTIPDGVRALFAAVDIQTWGYDVLMRGFGLERESWIIDRFQIRETADGTPIDPTAYPEHWDRLVDMVLRASYPLADRSGRRMLVRAMAYDTGGEAGVSEQAGDAWRRWRAKQIVRPCGVGPHGDLFNVLPTKGMSHRTAAKLLTAYPERNKPRADRPTAWWGAPLAEFNPNLFKDELRTQLLRSSPGPGYVHFSAELLEPAPPHPFFEQLTAEERHADGTWHAKRKGAPNEVTDLMNGTAVVARAWGMRTLNADCPPVWAAPWDQNSLVVTMTEDGEVFDPSERRSPGAQTGATAPAAGEQRRGGFLGGRRNGFAGRR